jgi:alpha-galactosidase
VPRPQFPSGIPGLVSKLAALNFSFGIYAAASSVVCSGRPGSLFAEEVDARTFAAWGVAYIKYDLCGEYAYGNPRFNAFADAVARSGRPDMVISTEPFSIVPTPLHAEFAHLWRTGNDIDASYGTIINRADLNEKWVARWGRQRGRRRSVGVGVWPAPFPL